MKKYNVSFYYLAFLIAALILIPKNLSTIFGFVPTRLGLICFWFLIVIYEVIKKKLKLNDIKLKPFLIIYTLFIITTFLGYFNAIDKVLFFYTVSKYVCYGAFMFLIIKYPFEKKQINILFYVMLSSTFILSLYSFYQYFFDIGMGKSGIHKYPGAVGRVDATFHNPIYFAMFLLATLILYFFKITKTICLKEKIIYLLLILINMISIMLTFTRSVYILFTIVIFLMFVLAFFKKYKKNSWLFVIPTLFLVFSFYTIPGVKYVYASSIVQVLPQKFSMNFFKFTNKFFFTNIDTDIFFLEKTFGVERKNIDRVIVFKDRENVFSKKQNIVKSVSYLTKESSADQQKQIVINEDKNVEKEYIIKNDASLISRNLYKNYAKDVSKDYPLTGIGMGNYEKFVIANKDKYIPAGKKFGYPHNYILHLRAEAGIICTILFCILIIGLFLWFILKAILTKKSEYLFLSILWFALLILMRFESLFYDVQLLPLLLIITTLIIRFSDSKQEQKNNVIFISSVGGHLTQMLQLKEIFNEYDYVLITEKTDVTKNIRNVYKSEYLLYGSRNFLFSYIFKFSFNIFKSIYMFFKYNPDVIVTTGTHTAVPMCYIAWLFRRKIIFIESFAKRTSPTLSGRLIYPIATTFVVQWKSMLKFYPNAEYWGWIY